MVWDFGGQETYRTEILANPVSNYKMISYLYYVFDIQDYYRIMTSAMYFIGVFNLIIKYSPDAKIVFPFMKKELN